MPTKPKDKVTLTFDTGIRQMTELAIMLPLSRNDHTIDFCRLMQTLKITPADKTYLSRIDHKKLLSDKERTILTDEARGYFLALFMYYSLQMQDYTNWQQNTDDKLNQAELYGLVTQNVILSTLASLGWNDEAKAYKEYQHYNRVYQRYIKLRTVDRVYYQDHSFAPVFKELLIKNAGKRIALDPGKLSLVSKYADKLHACAKKYHYYTVKRCNVVGINVVIPAKAHTKL